MPTPSLSISEFSALVSAALDGLNRGSGSESSESNIGNGVFPPNGTDVGKVESKTNIAVPESFELTKPRSVWFDSPLIGTAFVGQALPSSGVCQGHGKSFKAGNPKDRGSKPGYKKKIRKQLTLIFNPRFDGRFSSSKGKMLLVQPPGEGPFPPAVTVPAIEVRGPIPAASMSDVDLGANCLYLGTGGACGKFTAQEARATTSTLSPPPAIMSERVESSPARGLFSRIKRHLSMTNLRPSATTTTWEDAEVIVGGQEQVQSATRRVGAAARENTLMSGPVVSFASSPSFHSALPTPSTTNSLLESCPDIARSVSTPPSLQGESLTSSPSVYSRESADASDLASYIGSSSSFFAAIAWGLDGRKGRIGSEESGDACTDGGASERSVGDRPSRESTTRHGSPMSDSEKKSATFPDILDYDTPELQTADCFMPYVPLIMQHERLQHQLRTRVSLDEVASLARSSLGSKTSVRPRATMSSLRDSYKASETTTRGTRSRRHVPPPLQASSSRLRSDSPTMRAWWNQAASTQREPQSPASTASSRSPITPRTHFNFSADVQSHTINESNGQSEDEDDEFHQSIRTGTATGVKPHKSNAPAKTTTPNVNVHPPTPPLPSLQPAFVEEYTQSKSSIGVIDAIDQKSAASAPPASPTSSISRKYTLRAPPPMAPPPSGPLPLPPTPSISFERTRRAIETSMKLSPLDSPPNAHHEWSTTSRTPPFIDGSPASTTGMHPVFKNPGQAEDVDATSFLNFTPEDDSGVALNDHRLSLGSVLTESVASSTFFSAQSHLSSLDIDDDDGSLLRLSMTRSRGSDELSVSSCASSQDTEGHARHATVTANTRANATVGRHLPTQLIGLGRQQLQGTSGNANAEWTLSLGSPPPRRVSKHMSVADVPRDRLLHGDTAAPSMLPSSDDSDSPAPTVPTRKLALRAPNIEALSLDQINLRARTKSESALGKRKPRGVSAARAGTLARNGNDDWTLSMPLPFFSKSAKATASVPREKVQDKPGDGVHSREPQRDIGVTVAGVDLYPGSYTRKKFDQDEASLAEVDASGAAPNVFTVPRVVSVGSGIERATRSRSDAKRVSLLDDEAFDTAPGEGSNSNLAKLDVLSRDLARFNDLLRHSRSLLEMRPGSSGSETQSDAGSFSSSVIGIFQGNEGLPGTSSLPRLQVCHDQVQVTSSAVPPTVSGARPSKSHLSAAKTKICSAVIQDQIAESITTMRFSSLAPPAPGSGGYRTSSSSSSSSATITPTKDRSSAPFASLPAVSNTQKNSSFVGKDGPHSPPSSSTPMIQSGMASTSAIAPSLRKFKSAGSSRSLRIDTNTTTLSVTPIADKDSLSGEITPKNASSVSPSPVSVPVEDDVLSTFLLESLATSNDLRTVSSMVGDPAPTHTASAGARSRRASCSSLTVRTCANLSGSPSSKMSAECLTMGSSALPPPCPQSSTSCPAPSESSSPIGQASHTEAALQNGASKSKSTFHHDIGTSLKIKLPPSRSSSVLSIASTSKTESTRPVALNLEYRIRQRRLLGVDASPLLIGQTDSAQIGQEANTLEKNIIVSEVDADSVCSDSYYYSARSSFSNGCTDQDMSGTESKR